MINFTRLFSLILAFFVSVTSVPFRSVADRARDFRVTAYCVGNNFADVSRIDASHFKDVTDVILPPFRCFRSSMQKDGGTAGYSYSSEVSWILLLPGRADHSIRYEPSWVRTERTASSREGIDILSILAPVTVFASVRAVMEIIAASRAIIVLRSDDPFRRWSMADLGDL